jgi:tetraacyldisaccharide 4'-kinase
MMITVFRILLIPLSVIYSFIISARNFFYNKSIFKTHTVSGPVISVGNISAGGTGKSPFVIFISDFFIKQGKKPAIISRGYKRESGKDEIVFDGKNISCTLDKCGDEPMMIAENLSRLNKEFFLVTGRDRVRTAKNVINNFKPGIIILDDAFQHRRIHRDIDIVLVDAEEMIHNKFAGSLILPSGNLRECMHNISRADIIIQNNKFDNFELLNNLIKYNKEIFTLNYSVKGFFDINGKEFKIEGKEVLAFAGIARPSSFFGYFEKLNCNIVDTIAFSDHHNYSLDDIARIKNKALKGAIFITTEKDFVKIKEFKDFINDFNVLFLKIELILKDSDRFFALIQNKLENVK